MKEFEKAWEENGGGICGKAACKKYYKVALGHLLVYLENNTDRGKDIVQVENYIKRELESFSQQSNNQPNDSHN